MLIQTHTIHPDSEAIFKAQATTPENIRATRSGIHEACTRCFKIETTEPGLKLRRCGKCKGVWYCSKECQIAHWPTHKKTCSPVDGSGIRRLVENFYANPLLNQYLQVCLVLHFDLLQHPRLDAPFMARVDVAIEPADIPEFLPILMGQPVQGTLRGMLQVNAFTPLPAAAMAALAPMRRQIWRAARESADKNGFARDPIGLVEFGNGSVGQTITVPVHVRAPALELARDASPWVMNSAVTGQTTELPLTIHTCMEFMNTHIRSDKKNQLLLRTDMRPSDIEIIRDAGAEASGTAARLLKAKMAREYIFRPMADLLQQTES
ncbi:hypothetical protein B0H15DRAFT_948533 [Mycena belliarum]|uniref:MYND-type domain-containing protein n=1 Tax=Mycena belliarum TaxID=1033014 RepID=A0AAD6XVH0_9AGAR|nr:hypothetical protein B0H15DRAFT_948533 [Mycena belliae]